MTNKAILLLIIQGVYRAPMFITWTILVATVWATLWPLDLIMGWNLNFWWLSGWQYLLLLPTPAMIINPILIGKCMYSARHMLTEEKERWINVQMVTYFPWVTTPDEDLPGDLDIPIVNKIYGKYGFYACSCYWLIRNCCHGIMWACAVPAPNYWHKITDAQKKEMGWRRHSYDFLGLRLRVGAWIFPNPHKVKHDSDFVMCPHITLRRAT